MKMITYWWGCRLIPEDELDVAALKRIPLKAVASYEGGVDGDNNVVWTEADQVDVQQLGYKPEACPLGIVVEIGR